MQVHSSSKLDSEGTQRMIDVLTTAGYLVTSEEELTIDHTVIQFSDNSAVMMRVDQYRALRKDILESFAKESWKSE